MICPEIKADSLSTKISGSGRVELGGTCEEQDVLISSAGKYEARRLKSQTAKVKISGSGSVYLDVAETLDSRISGSGSVHYHGRPIVTFSKSGIGKVKRLETV